MRRVVALPDDELAKRGLAHHDRYGRHLSEGHRQFIEMAGWAVSEGRQKSLVVVVAQLRKAHARVTRSGMSMILNRWRAPSLVLAGAIEREFGVQAGAWSLAPKLQVNTAAPIVTIKSDKVA